MNNQGKCLNSQNQKISDNLQMKAITYQVQYQHNYIKLILKFHQPNTIKIDVYMVLSLPKPDLLKIILAHFH